MTEIIPLTEYERRELDALYSVMYSNRYVVSQVETGATIHDWDPRNVEDFMKKMSEKAWKKLQDTVKGMRLVMEENIHVITLKPIHAQCLELHCSCGSYPLKTWRSEVALNQIRDEVSNHMEQVNDFDSRRAESKEDPRP